MILSKVEALSIAHPLSGKIEVYRKSSPYQTMLLKISGECVQNQLEVIAAQVGYLHTHHIYPIILPGWGEILNQKLGDAKIYTPVINGNRVTTSEVLSIIESMVTEMSTYMGECFSGYGVRVSDLTSTPVFTAKPLGKQWGYVGGIATVDTTPIKNACIQGVSPLVFPLGWHDGQMYNLNADTAATGLALNLKPQMYIALTKTGGILEQGKILPEIQVPSGYHDLALQDIISGGMLKKVEEANVLITNMPSMKVYITSPKNLLTDLTTNQSTGTIIVADSSLRNLIGHDEQVPLR